MKLFLLTFLLLPLSSLAQQTSIIFSQVGPLNSVLAQPCQLTQLAYITDVPAGQNVYICTASFNRQNPGTWTPLGTGSAVTSPSLNGAAYWNGSALATTATGGAGTLCLNSTNGGPAVWGACSGSAASAFQNIAAGTNTNTLTMGSGGLLTFTGSGLINANALSGTPLGNLATGILKITTGSGAPTIAVAADFPTLNQNTTGTAASITGINPPGNGGTGVANTATETLGSANHNWATLGTGLVKNTTATGGLSNPTFLDIVALFASCTGTQYLGADGNCHTAIGGGLGDPGGTGIVKRTTLNTTVVAVAADFPTLNQNTTGTAANLTGIAAPINGGTGVANTASLTLGTANVNLSVLGTGVVKNTTVTGALSNALSADIVSLFSTCSGIQYLGADGACHNAAANALADPGSNGVVKRTALNATAIATSTDITGLFTSCSGTQYLGADGACHNISLPGGAALSVQYQASATTFGGVSIGTANQLFGVNNGATGYEFKAVTATLAGALSAAGTVASSGVAVDADHSGNCGQDQIGVPATANGWVGGCPATPLYLGFPATAPSNTVLYFPAPVTVNGAPVSIPTNLSFGSDFTVSGGTLSLSADTLTVNGQLIALGASGDVNAGAVAHSIPLNEGAATALAGLTLGAHQFPVGHTGADPTAVTLPNCPAGAVSYTQASDTAGCNTIPSTAVGGSQQTFSGTTVTVPGLGTTVITYACFAPSGGNFLNITPSGAPSISGTAPNDVSFTFGSSQPASSFCNISAGGSVGHSFTASFSGSSVANAVVGYGIVPFACTINSWAIQSDATTLTFKVWKLATGAGTALPTSAASINTSGLSLSTPYTVSTTVTDFTTLAVAAKDQYAVVLSAVTGTPTFAYIFVGCAQ